jgi:N-acetylglucosamine malate deacetylase 1
MHIIYHFVGILAFSCHTIAVNCIVHLLRYKMKIDLLAIGVHPDDVELSCAGTLVMEKKNGKTTGIIDLTQGELGTRGTKETRYEEAGDAAKILGIDIRENLKMADGFFENNELNQRKIITILRKYRPEIVLCNAIEDRHPDHGRSAALVNDAVFLSGLMKIETLDEGITQQPWRPKYLLHYIQDRYLKPDFIMDITDAMELKIASIKAYKTQFYDPTSSDSNNTYISTPEFFDSIVARAAMFGKMIGVKYGEGFISKKAIGLRNLNALVQENT